MINNFIDKNRYNFSGQDGADHKDDDLDGVDKTTDKDDLNDTKIDKDNKLDKAKAK